MTGHIHTFPQGGPEWHDHRLGRVTASRVADLMALTKSGPAASRKNYMADLIAERLTAQPRDSYTNAAMEWGTAHEAQARATYAFVTDCDVQEVGFIDHPTIPMAGCSPDGLIGADGMLEIKCPNTATHIDTLINGTINSKYKKQMMFQMACAGRAWCDFVSFDPRLSPAKQLWIKRILFDRASVLDIEKAVCEFQQDLTHQVDVLNQTYPEAA